MALSETHDGKLAEETRAKPGIAGLDEIKSWLVNYVAKELELEPQAIDPGTKLERYGLDSAAAVDLVGALEAWLGVDLDPTLPYDYPSIDELARHLVENHG